MVFVALTLAAGDERDLANVALTHAALSVAGTTARLFIDGKLVCILNNARPQTPVTVNVGTKPVAVRCEGSGVHLFGRAANSTGAPDTSTARKRTRPPAAAQDGPLEAPPIVHAQARVPKLRFNPEVLVAEYFPKRCGISPERRYESLDHMVEARAAQRAADEAEFDEEDEDDEDDEGFQGGAMTMDMLQQMLLHASAPKGNGGGDVYQRLAELVAKEKASREHITGPDTDLSLIDD